ncbi:hypothetical protein RAB80_009193 [Fusarium oxysporum f. sp. vasinfectum]|nr:hypothetical protein RAB80_009193 [Fusarium oxysporum f. sp. vasinfectum]
MSDQMSRASGMNTTLGADGMAVGIPISTGLDGGLSHMSNTTNSFQAASDFVYAYRLCEVYYSKKVRLKPYSQGETYAVGQVEKDGTGTDQSEEASEDEEIPGISVDGICNVDYSGDGILEKATESGFEDEEYYLLN